MSELKEKDVRDYLKLAKEYAEKLRDSLKQERENCLKGITAQADGLKKYFDIYGEKLKKIYNEEIAPNGSGTCNTAVHEIHELTNTARNGLTNCEAKILSFINNINVKAGANAELSRIKCFKKLENIKNCMPATIANDPTIQIGNTFIPISMLLYCIETSILEENKNTVIDNLKNENVIQSLIKSFEKEGVVFSK